MHLDGAEYPVIDVGVGGGVLVERASVERARAAVEAELAEEAARAERAGEEKALAAEARLAERAAFAREFEMVIDKLFEVALAGPAPAVPPGEAWPIPADVRGEIRRVWTPYLTWRAGFPAAPEPPYQDRLGKLQELAGLHARSTFQGWEKRLRKAFKSSLGTEPP